MATKTSKSDSLYNELLHKVLNGTYPAGTLLPREIDLARQTGVSRGILRIALGRLEKEGMIERVKRKGTLVRDVRRGLPKILAIHFGSLDSQSPVQYILPGMQEGAANEHVTLDFMVMELFTSMPEEDVRRMLKDGGFDGVILIRNNLIGDEKELSVLKSAGVPVLLPHAHPLDRKITGFSTMRPDFKLAVRDALGHLAERGHRRVATLNLNFSEWLDVMKARGGEKGRRLLDESGYGEPHFRDHSMTEYQRLLDSLGMNPGPEWIKEIHYDEKELDKAVGELLSLSAPPTAVMCFSDSLATMLYGTLAKRRLAIPSDIAVMGLSGFPSCAYLTPPLSTIDLEYLNIGRLSIGVMKRIIESKGGNAASEYITPHKLVVRESTQVQRLG